MTAEQSKFLLVVLARNAVGRHWLNVPDKRLATRMVKLGLLNKHVKKFYRCPDVVEYTATDEGRRLAGVTPTEGVK